MPKKSDRSRHGTAMSRLFPDVSLEEDRGEGEKAEESDGDSRTAELKNNRTAELENEGTTEPKNHSAERMPNHSAKEVQNYSSAHQARRQVAEASGGEALASAEVPRPAVAERPPALQPFPRERPDLSRKMGPYVSEDVYEALEDVYLTLRRRFGSEANKSLIVEAALRYALSDCLERGGKSGLAKWLEQVLSSSSE